MLLATYDFVSANKLFCYNLVSSPADTKSHESPFSAFLSLTSYILHHAYRSDRSTLYGILNLSTLRILTEDAVLCKCICNPTETLFHVRLCRQRQPFLPATLSPRPAVAHILDLAIDTINHNLRRRLDLDLYVGCTNLIHRLVCYLAQNHIHVLYHWSLLWQSLLALLRFLQTYATDFIAQPIDIAALLTPLLKSLALAATQGVAFLPIAADYDDLFYKFVENYEYMTKLQAAYDLPLQTSAIAVPLAVAKHFHTLLEEEIQQGKLGKNPSPKDVLKVVRKGYETLAVPPMDGMGLENWERYREAEEKGMIKKVGRKAVEDVRILVGGF